jgi:hypothetical protein
MREKAELKRRYKQLIIDGKQEEADKVLEEIWQLCGINKRIPVVKVKEKYTKEELEKLSFKELRVVGYKVGTKDRSRVGLIKEILELQ